MKEIISVYSDDKPGHWASLTEKLQRIEEGEIVTFSSLMRKQDELNGPSFCHLYMIYYISILYYIYLYQLYKDELNGPSFCHI